MKAVKTTAGAILGASAGWLIGLFFHVAWWSLYRLAGGAFDLSSGSLVYTAPYAFFGALLGAEHFENYARRLTRKRR